MGGVRKNKYLNLDVRNMFGGSHSEQLLVVVLLVGVLYIF
jgi:hypothetical protein